MESPLLSSLPKLTPAKHVVVVASSDTNSVRLALFGVRVVVMRWIGMSTEQGAFSLDLYALGTFQLVREGLLL